MQTLNAQTTDQMQPTAPVTQRENQRHSFYLSLFLLFRNHSKNGISYMLSQCFFLLYFLFLVPLLGFAQVLS